MFAVAIFADATGGTDHTLAGIGDTFSARADFTSRALDFAARIGLTFSIDALFVLFTLDFCTGFDALTVTTERVSGAFLGGTGVGHTLALDTDFACGTAFDVAIVFHTEAVDTDLS